MLLIGGGLLALVVIGLVVLLTVVSGGDDDEGDTSTASTPSGGDVHVPLAVGSSGTIWPERNGKKQTKVTILAIQDGARSTNQFSQPAAGKKYYAIQVELENVGTEEVTSLSWKIRDSKDVEGDMSFVTGIDPRLDQPSGMTPGGKASGWVVFTIDADATPKWIRADPNTFLKNDLYFDAP